MCIYSTCDYYGNGGCAYERITSCVRPCKEEKHCHFNPYLVSEKDNVRLKHWKFSEAKAKTLYDLGYVDEAISNELGVSRVTVHQWRKANNLPPQKRRRKRSVSNVV